MLSENPTLPQTTELHTIQRLVARLRTAAYQGMPSADIAILLDDVQYLLSLQIDQPLAGEKPAVEEFNTYIQDIERRYPGFAGLSTNSAKASATTK